MKVQSLFDLVNAAYGVLNLFENVDTAEQMVSRLERLKRGQYPDGVLDAVEDLREATEQMMADTIDQHPDSEGFEEEPEGDLDDPELDEISGSAEEEEEEEKEEKESPEKPGEESVRPDPATTDHHPV